ncbi:ABC transporter permease [Oceanisphaera pacifica]|uniref:FtsX-like permease family protein n=1 Tax=Oceanisphaera pacifica TaxID=2818389 RepID=A0ABS3NF30_9GAMM|nr:FtsX-like permease family protein [Oceanisphaera pacifica]MBO1518988.1 FtsX-like permease family protein [Oceanisphaera pacifica]
MRSLARPTLGWGLVWREIGRGPLRLFMLALALSVASILSVTLVADRLTQALNMSGRDYIAADQVLSGSRAAEPTWLDEAKRQGLAVSRTQSFQSVLFADDKLQLASVRAVDASFPFYGELVLAPSAPVTPGHIWLSSRLLALLALEVGDTLELGNTELSVAGELIKEPDQGLSPALLAPRALIHLDDVAASGIQMAGSRVSYRYLFKGEAQPLAQYAAWLTPKLKQGQTWQGPDNTDSPVARPLAQAEQFFRLASLIGVLLGIVAMAIALGYFSYKEQDRMALLKTLGASRRQLFSWLARLLVSLLCVGFLLGAVVGYGVHKLILLSLGDALAIPLAAPSVTPFAIAIGMALLTTLMLSLVPMARLLKVPPLRVLRHQASASISIFWTAAILLGGTFVLSGLFAQSWSLAAGLLLGLLVLIVILGTACWLMLTLLRRFNGSIGFRLALSRLQRARWATLMQFGGVALALFLGSLLWVVRGELVGGFLANLPPDTPNRFLINIASEQREPLRARLDQAEIARSQFYPIVRGRLTQINEQAVAANVDASDQQNAGTGRELNLTYSEQLPYGNRLIAGQWSRAANSVSVESGLAERLALTLGDTITLDLAGQQISATVRNVREVDWNSMRPNFYFIFSPDVLADYPATWLASFYLPPEQKALEVELIRAFPTMTLLDVEALLQQLRQVLAQVSQALLVIMALVTGASILVLLAQLETTLASRRRELLLLRTLGASLGLIKSSLHWEWLAAGLVSGLAAAVAVELCVAILLPYWLGLSWQPHPLLWVGLPLLGAVLLLLTGRLGGMTSNTLMSRLRQW